MSRKIIHKSVGVGSSVGGHVSVLLNEVMEWLKVEDCRVFVDGTLGLGGHSCEALRRNADLEVIGFDVDERNLELAERNLVEFAERMRLVRRNFAEMDLELEDESVDAVLLDLGVSSLHFDEAERGFSLKNDGKLDMRLDLNLKKSAFDVVNFYSVEELSRIFEQYGEERFAKLIAKKIVERRRKEKFVGTVELAEFVASCLPKFAKGKSGKKKFGIGKSQVHPATKVFQAIRIEVNSELEILEKGLSAAVRVLRKGGRVAVISFHSLEDRLVKNYFREAAKKFLNVEGVNETIVLNPKLNVLTKKPVVPTSEESLRNARSRSAKLRVAEKI